MYKLSLTLYVAVMPYGVIDFIRNSKELYPFKTTKNTFSVIFATWSH